MNETGADLPLRQLTRLRAEMAVAAAQLTATLFADDLMLGVEFGIAALVSLPDWASGGTIVRPAVTTRAITIRKMALSLGSAAETTRRHVNVLRDRGALQVSTAGVSLAPSAENEVLARRYYLGIHDLFLRLIEDMAATCDLELPLGAAPAFGAADVIGRALEVLLLPIDTFRPAAAGRMAFLLWGALTVVAVRAVTYDPVLSRRHANAIPPDDLRAGISLRRLAAMLSIPYATTWRQVRALEAAGLVSRLGADQWTVLTANLLDGAVAGISTPPSILVFRRVRELALLGLDPARAGEHYAVARPPLARID